MNAVCVKLAPMFLLPIYSNCRNTCAVSSWNFLAQISASFFNFSESDFSTRISIPNTGTGTDPEGRRIRIR